MNQYIEKDKVLSLLGLDHNDYVYIDKRELAKKIEKLKGIDAVSVVRGEWKHLKGDEWLCSNCGYVVWTEGSWEHPLERGKDYCEYCGAKMKEADDE